MLALALVLAAAPLVDVEAERLARGEVVLHFAEVPGSDYPVATARVLVDAPPSRVWPIVADCERTGEVMPDVATAAVVAERGGTSRCTVVVDLPFPLGDLTSVTRAALDVRPGQQCGDPSDRLRLRSIAVILVAGA